MMLRNQWTLLWAFAGVLLSNKAAGTCSGYVSTSSAKAKQNKPKLKYKQMRRDMPRPNDWLHEFHLPFPFIGMPFAFFSSGSVLSPELIGNHHNHAHLMANLRYMYFDTTYNHPHQNGNVLISYPSPRFTRVEKITCWRVPYWQNPNFWLIVFYHLVMTNSLPWKITMLLLGHFPWLC